MSTGVGFAVGFPQLGCENPHQLVRIMDFTPVLRADCIPWPRFGKPTADLTPVSVS